MLEWSPYYAFPFDKELNTALSLSTEVDKQREVFTGEMLGNTNKMLGVGGEGGGNLAMAMDQRPTQGTHW